jgi:hypothetical protein
MKSFRTRGNELAPILDSYEKNEQIAKLEKSIRTKKILCTFSLVILIIFVLTIIVIGGGVTTVYFVLRQVLDERCMSLLQNDDAFLIPSRDTFTFFSNDIQDIHLSLPNPSSWARNSIQVERSRLFTNITLRMTLKAFKNESLSLISYKLDTKDNKLTVLMEDRSSWASYDCPTVFLLLTVPEDSSLNNIYIENNSRGKVDVIRLSAETLYVSSIGSVNLQSSQVSKVELGGASSTLVRDHQCAMNSHLSSLHVESSSFVNLQNIRDCSKIQIAGGNPITISDINTHNCSIVVNSYEGNQNYLRFTKFRELVAESLSSNMIFEASQEIPSTEFHLKTGAGRILLSGFRTNPQYIINEPFEKNGKLSCGATCEKYIYLGTRRGTVSLTNKNS